MIFTFMRHNRDTDKNSVLYQENPGDIACFGQEKTLNTQKNRKNKKNNLKYLQDSDIIYTFGDVKHDAARSRAIRRQDAMKMSSK